MVDQQDRLIASASQDKTIRVWHLNSDRGTPAAILGGHTDMVNKVAFDSKHHVLISASDDGTCRVWNLRDVYEDASRVHTNVPFKSVSIWQIDMPTRSSKVFWVSINPTVSKFVCGGKDGILHVVEYENMNSGLKASVSDRLSAGGNRGGRGKTVTSMIRQEIILVEHSTGGERVLSMCRQSSVAKIHFLRDSKNETTSMKIGDIQGKVLVLRTCEDDNVPKAKVGGSSEHKKYDSHISKEHHSNTNVSDFSIRRR